MVQNATFLARIGQQPGGPGRATKYDPDRHPLRVMELAQEGEFPEAWAADIGVTFLTFRNWCRDHEEFRDAFEAARLLLETHWTRDLVKNRTNPDARPGLYALIMRRFSHYYGPNAPDLWGWFQGKDPVPSATPAPGTAPAAMPDADQPVNQTASADLERRLEALRKRRAEAERGQS
jgi:hypothetical protein